MDKTKRILICGAGIAGPACAWWLCKYGFSVVVAEKARAFRDGGQNVDVKGAGQQVIERMGLTAQIEARNTLECGQKWLDEAGKAQIATSQCLPGYLQAEDLARMALFLAADDSRLITSQTFIVDGGVV